MNVLHIEDRRENRLLVRKLLEARGHRVTDAADGLTGIELALAERPELILVDINIPGLDGYEVVTRLKGQGATSAACPWWRSRRREIAAGRWPWGSTASSSSPSAW
ncbi:MAG: response regulator [bacterium]